MVRSVTERSEIQSEEDTSVEDDSDRSLEEEESSGLKKKSSPTAGRSKPKNGLALTKKSTLKSPLKSSTAIDSSDESDDNVKLSFYLPKLPIEKRRKAVLKCLPDANRMKRKKGVETNVGSPFSSEIFVEVSSKLYIVIQKLLLQKSKPKFVDENDSDDESDDVTQSKKKQLSPRQSSGDSSEVPSDESDAEPKQSILEKKRSSMVDATVIKEYQ